MLVLQWFPVTPEAVRIILGQKIPGAESGATSSALGRAQEVAVAPLLADMAQEGSESSVLRTATPHGPAMGWDCTDLMEWDGNDSKSQEVPGAKLKC